MTEPNVLSIKDLIAGTTEKIINGLWKADIEIKPDDYIKPEGYVDLDGELYIAKTIEKLKTKGITTFRVSLEHNMTELNGFFVGPFEWTDKTCAEMLALALTGTPWTAGVTDISGTQSVESTKKISVLAALQIIVKAFIGELYFHSKTRIIDIKSEIGIAHKLPIRYDKNTDYIKKIENSDKLCTRLYIYGIDDTGETEDLTIESVSPGGLPYLESTHINDYKYVKEYAIYTNINDVNRLLAYGQFYLATYELPLRNYITTIVDKVNFPEWGSEVIGIGDTIRMYDKELITNEDVRIKRIVKDLVNPIKTTIELVNTIERVTDLLSRMNYYISSILTYANDGTTSGKEIKKALDELEDQSDTHSGKSTLMFIIPGALIPESTCIPIPMPYTASIDKVFIYVMGAPQNNEYTITDPCIIVQIYVDGDPIFGVFPIEIRPHINHLEHFDEATPNFPRINKNELVYPTIVRVGDLVQGTDLVIQVRCR